MCSVCPLNRKDHHCEIHLRALFAHLGGCETNRHSWESRFLYHIAGYFLRDLDALCVILVMQTATILINSPLTFPQSVLIFFVACPRPPATITIVPLHLQCLVC